MMKATAFMMKKNDPLHETLGVFHEAGLVPVIRHGRKHIKVRAKKHSRSILAVVGATPSDQRAGLTICAGGGEKACQSPGK
jgi:hypothetical protein